MGLQKGKTNNPNGRKKGIPNKTTVELKEAIVCIVSNNIDKLQADINSLEPKERLLFIEKLFKYVIPPMQAEAEEVKPKSFDFMQMIIENIRKEGCSQKEKLD